MNIYSTSCCAVDDIGGLSDTKSPCLAVQYTAHKQFSEEEPAAFYIFTETTKGSYGRRLKAYIEKRGLGSVVVAPAKKNPNSENSVRPYMWVVNRGALRKFWKENKTDIYCTYSCNCD